MRSSGRALWCGLSLAGLLYAGHARAQYLGAAPLQQTAPSPALADTSQTVTMLLAATRPALALRPGDQIEIAIFEIDKFAYKTRINSDGAIGLPLIRSISLTGLTVEQAETAIANRLQTDGMVNDAHVQITVIEAPSEIVTVAGQVARPGVFNAYGAPTLLSVLSQASGLSELASRTVTLIRPSAPQAYTLNLGSDPATSRIGMIPVFAGDTIAVGAVGVVYVVGAVKTTGVYRLKTQTPTTASQAVAMAGGAGFEGITDKAEIVRTVGDKRIEIPFNYHDALHHAGLDPVLMADDIVFIPTARMKAALKGGALSLAVGLAAAILYRQ